MEDKSYNISDRIKLLEKFLSGGAERFGPITPETTVFMHMLNNRIRSIQDIEADLKENDAFCSELIAKFAYHDLIPEENPDLDIKEVGLKHKIYKNFRDVCDYGNAFFIELIICQFSYYVDKLKDTGYNALEDFIQDRLKELADEQNSK